MTESNIFFLDPDDGPTGKIVQIYPHLELFAEGEPPRNTIFVQGRQPGPTLGMDGPNRLLLIDPPADAGQRFRLEGEAAALFTGERFDIGLPQVETQAGGVAHVRIGDHFLDIYAQDGNNIVYFPALGILCSGPFGSDAVGPRVAPGSDGSAEVETLRLLASLLKRAHFQLLIPGVGSLADDPVRAMQRLAADVAYLNGLQRTVNAGLQHGEAVETIEMQCASLLPAERRSAAGQALHDANVDGLIAASG